MTDENEIINDDLGYVEPELTIEDILAQQVAEAIKYAEVEPKTSGSTMDGREIQERENKLRADAAAMVMGNVFGSFLRDIQALQGEIAVLNDRAAKSQK